MSLFGHQEDRFAAVWSQGRLLQRGGPPEAWLQRLAPRTRVFAAVLMLGTVLVADGAGLLFAVYLLCCAGAVAGRLDVGGYLRSNLLLVALFVAPAALLGSLSFFVPGRPAFRLGPLVFTEPGLRAAVLLCLRALDAVAVTTLLVRSLGLRGVVNGLRDAGLPESVGAVLQMALAHIHLLARTAGDMMLGLRARSARPQRLADVYRTVAVQGVVLLHKSTAASRDTHAAMLSRGFSGSFPRAEEVRPGWRREDLAVLAGCALLLVAALL